jgi:hypothetical protein
LLLYGYFLIIPIIPITPMSDLILCILECRLATSGIQGKGRETCNNTLHIILSPVENSVNSKPLKPCKSEQRVGSLSNWGSNLLSPARQRAAQTTRLLGTIPVHVRRGEAAGREGEKGTKG